MALQKEIWLSDLKEQPLPDTSFVFASEDKSEYVDNNTLHLQEAGIEPAVHENFFATNANAELPIAGIDDIPHEVTLKIYSSEVTRHRNLEEVELAYNKRQSIIGRHRTAINKALAARAAFAWTPTVDNTHNKLIKLGSTDSVIDAVTDLRAFYMDLDKNEKLNLVLTSAHWAAIKKEDKKLYKELMAEKNKVYGDFKIHMYSQAPLFTSAGVKKPFGATQATGDTRASFAWVSNEVFRCFGDVEMYMNEKQARIQADLISFGQRALVGNIRATSPKYLGAII